MKDLSEIAGLEEEMIEAEEERGALGDTPDDIQARAELTERIREIKAQVRGPPGGRGGTAVVVDRAGTPWQQKAIAGASWGGRMCRG